MARRFLWTVTLLNGLVKAVGMDFLQASDVPTLNQNTTGTAAGLSATLAAGNGGTGRTTLAAHATVIGNGASAVNVAGPGSTGQVLTGGGASADPTYQGFASICEGRITLQSGTAVPTTDRSTASTFYFTPYNGNRIAIPLAGGGWEVLTFTETSLSPLFGASTAYDVFGYDSSGTLALFAQSWAGVNTRDVALQRANGVLTNAATVNGQAAGTCRYLGTILTHSDSVVYDTTAQRYVWNYYHRAARPLRVLSGTATWTYATATWRQANADPGNKVELVVGVVEDAVRVEAHATLNTLSTSAASVGVGLDSTSANSATVYGECSGGPLGGLGRAVYEDFPTAGYHAFNWLEYSRAGTTTFGGNNGTLQCQSGLIGTIRG